jgi:subtilisin family serine protease
VVVVSAPPDQAVFNTEATGDNPILAIEPERVVYALADDTLVDLLPVPITAPQPLTHSTFDSGSASFESYLMGYRDAVNHLVDQLLDQRGTTRLTADEIGAELSETTDTWGLQVTNVTRSRYTGRGVRVAVLDTGMDLGHPDFAGRAINSQSFITGESVQDGHGHGTHCIGTACGPLRPGRLPRYGVAYEAEIYAGKVLSNAGRGSDGGILAGIEWAITNGCAVISMSLGAAAQVGQPFSQVFETVARRALAAGALIIAAAGNGSRRPASIAPVSHPANCPSIMSVAALDSQLAIAPFSCAGLNPQGGQVDVAGPGVAVISSVPRPQLYRAMNGTSMATPHVAGIAALHAQANPAMRGGTLGWLLLQSARRLNLPTRDVGAGLVQAP